MGTCSASRIFRFNCHAYVVEFQSLLNYFLVLGFLILHRAVNLLEIDTFHNWVSVLNQSCKVTEDDVLGWSQIGEDAMQKKGPNLIRPKSREVVFLDDLTFTFRNQL